MGLEPTTPCLQSRCSSQLSYVPEGRGQASGLAVPVPWRPYDGGVLPPAPRTPTLPPPPPPVPPGWYPDPWRTAPWRWWDGRMWTPIVAGAEARRPRLPAWLSPLIIAASVLIVPLLLYTATQSPESIALALVPMAIVLPALAWLDRIEPEPWSSRVHAMLWGATVAVVVAGVANTIVAIAWSEILAAVVSAPVVEETMKGLGVYWAVRRREIDGVLDGIVYAGWVAVGFAAIENVQYFWQASADGVLAETFVIRALITPFAHPLFTAWIGLAIGRAVATNRPVLPRALVGLAVSIGLHMSWNGSLVAADQTGNAGIVGLAALAFVGVFVSTIVMVVRVRRRERQQLLAAVPVLAARYGIDPADAAVFASWRTVVRTRRHLHRGDRRRFDDLHATLARLAALHARPGPVDAGAEARLVAHLRAIGPTHRLYLRLRVTLP